MSCRIFGCFMVVFLLMSPSLFAEETTGSIGISRADFTLPDGRKDEADRKRFKDVIQERFQENFDWSDTLVRGTLHDSSQQSTCSFSLDFRGADEEDIPPNYEPNKKYYRVSGSICPPAYNLHTEDAILIGIPNVGNFIDFYEESPIRKKASVNPYTYFDLGVYSGKKDSHNNEKNPELALVKAICDVIPLVSKVSRGDYQTKNRSNKWSIKDNKIFLSINSDAEYRAHLGVKIFHRYHHDVVYNIEQSRFESGRTVIDVEVEDTTKTITLDYKFERSAK